MATTLMIKRFSYFFLQVVGAIYLIFAIFSFPIIGYQIFMMLALLTDGAILYLPPPGSSFLESGIFKGLTLKVGSLFLTSVLFSAIGLGIFWVSRSSSRSIRYKNVVLWLGAIVLSIFIYEVVYVFWIGTFYKDVMVNNIPKVPVLILVMVALWSLYKEKSPVVLTKLTLKRTILVFIGICVFIAVFAGAIFVVESLFL